MHRISLAFFFIAALYVSSCGVVTAQENNAPRSDATVQPNIALLLPLKSAAFGQAAEVVRLGFFAGIKAQPGNLPVRVYASSDERSEVVGLYRQAVANGARVVIGPLTRDGVAALAAEPSIPVPVLALNAAGASDQHNLYFFGLPAEDEARQIAQIAMENNPREAIVIHGVDPRSLRLAQAFSAEWERRGGSVATDIAYAGDSGALAGLRARHDAVVFFALEAEPARQVRSYINPALPVFATSQIFNGNAESIANFDLNGVRFVDMPWMLQPDHAAVMIYPRMDPTPGPELERLYALGIDAWRLLQVLMRGATHSADMPLDGVTGQIRLDGRLFRREAVQAVFRQGMGVLLDAPESPPPSMFPGQPTPAQ
ncbi:MAG: penicillin-binding protein activator [Gallionellaceae bacterium]|jgi:outer membrane PBP1 activator LpoA protein|nr:penicillin-binding protein activator [Gallionellaceae bacterium]